MLGYEHQSYNKEIIETLIVLLQNSQSNEHEFMNEIVQQINSLNEQIAQLSSQLEEVKKYNPPIKENVMKEELKNTVTNVEKRNNLISNLFNSVKSKIAEAAASYIAEIKNNSEIKLYSFLDKVDIQGKLCSIKNDLEKNIEDLSKASEKVCKALYEVEKGKQNFKNAINILGGKKMVHFQKKSNIVVLLLKLEKINTNMLNSVNRAIAAFDKLENSVQRNKPSVLKKIGELNEKNKISEPKSKNEIDKKRQSEAVR